MRHSHVRPQPGPLDHARARARPHGRQRRERRDASGRAGSPTRAREGPAAALGTRFPPSLERVYRVGSGTDNHKVWFLARCPLFYFRARSVGSGWAVWRVLGWGMYADLDQEAATARVREAVRADQEAAAAQLDQFHCSRRARAFLAE